MAKFNAPGSGAYASAPAAGLLVVNDHEWVVEPKANGDLVYIGDLPAHHKIFAEGCSVYAIETGVAGDELAAMTFDVFVGEAKTAANTVVDNLAVTADTGARSAFSTHLLCEALGASDVNRPIYLDFSAAPATREGKIVVRMASFAK